MANRGGLRAAAGTFGFYRFLTQIISWTITVLVARILRPEDYGLMAIAGLFTGYVEVFSELGLGAAIIQRLEVTKEELSSNFWFSILVGIALALLTLPLAHVTAWAFHDPRVLRITESISVLFLCGGMMVVPSNLLQRDMRFGAIGASQLAAAVVAGGAMFWFATHGYGVWTLILGAILSRFTSMVVVFVLSGWRPGFHYSFREVRPFLRFGLNVAAARSVYYIFQKADKFLVGKVLGPEALGHYSFALDLASAPHDRVIAAANQFSYPVFARRQADPALLRSTFLRITQAVAWVAFPIYLGGAAFGDLLTPVLGAKWAPAIWLFRFFCIAYLAISATSLTSVLQNAIGRPRAVLLFDLASILLVAPGIFIAAHFGLGALVIPWVLIYPVMLVVWMVLTLRVVSIPVGSYLRVFRTPLLASGVMVASGAAARAFIPRMGVEGGERAVLLGVVLLGVLGYGGTLFLLERRAILELWTQRRTRRSSGATPTP